MVNGPPVAVVVATVVAVVEVGEVPTGFRDVTVVEQKISVIRHQIGLVAGYYSGDEDTTTGN